MKKLVIPLIFVALVFVVLIACEDPISYGVLRIEVWNYILSGPGDGWHIFIDGEYIGRPLEGMQSIGAPDVFEKTVTVGDHTISGYWQTDVQTPMTPQTVFVGLAGLTFFPSRHYQ